MYELVEKYLKLYLDDMKREKHPVYANAYYLNFGYLSVYLSYDMEQTYLEDVYYKSRDTGLSVKEKEKIHKVIRDYLVRKEKERLKELEKELEIDLEKKKPTKSLFRRLFSKKGE